MLRTRSADRLQAADDLTFVLVLHRVRVPRSRWGSRPEPPSGASRIGVPHAAQQRHSASLNERCPHSLLAAAPALRYHETSLVINDQAFGLLHQGGAEVNRAELQAMAEERVKDAKALLDGGRWEFAYYTAGYAVEYALKSCLLARMIHTAWVFQEKWDAKQCLTHEFERLIDLAGMRGELNNRLAASAAAASAPGPPAGAFAAYWGASLKWKVESRYQPRTEAEARELYEALTHDPDGVLPWIKNFW